MNQSGSSHLSVEFQANALEQLCVVLTDIFAWTDGHIIIGKVYALRSAFNWNIGSLLGGQISICGRFVGRILTSHNRANTTKPRSCTKMPSLSVSELRRICVLFGRQFFIINKLHFRLLLNPILSLYQSLFSVNTTMRRKYTTVCMIFTSSCTTRTTQRSPQISPIGRKYCGHRWDSIQYFL